MVDDLQDPYVAAAPTSQRATPRRQLAWAGAMLNLIGIGSALATLELAAGWWAAALSYGALTLLALVALGLGRDQAGARLLLWGSVLLIPLGAVGVLGASRLLHDAASAAPPPSDRRAPPYRRSQRHMEREDWMVKASGRGWQRPVGILMILVGLPLVVLQGTSLLVVLLGAYFIWLGGYYKSNPVVELHEQHMVIRLAPLRGPKTVRYEDIRRVEHDPGKKLVIHTDEAVSIPLNLLEPVDAHELGARFARF